MKSAKQTSISVAALSKQQTHSIEDSPEYRLGFEAGKSAQPVGDKTSPAELTGDYLCEWILNQWEKFYGLRANPKQPPDIDYDFISAVIAVDRALRTLKTEVE